MATFNSGRQVKAAAAVGVIVAALVGCGDDASKRPAAEGVTAKSAPADPGYLPQAANPPTTAPSDLAGSQAAAAAATQPNGEPGSGARAAGAGGASPSDAGGSKPPGAGASGGSASGASGTSAGAPGAGASGGSAPGAGAPGAERGSGSAPPGAGQGAAPAAAGEGGPRESAGGVSWAMPKGWTLGKPAPMRLATITDGKADVAITAFGGNVGGTLANVNRWRAQISVPPIASEAEAEKMMSTVDAGGRPVRVLDMSGPQQRVLVAIVPGDDKLFFFKMTAPSDVVAQRKAAFEEMVKTIRLD